MKVCPNCGKQYPDDANFCPVDAGRLSPSDKPKKAEAKSKPDASAASAESDKKTDLLGGRFKLGDRIGGGLTGEVHRATDTRSGDACAVKLVDASVFPSSLLLQRTERELKQLARLNHAGIVKVLDHGRDGKTLWIASELCEGRSLHDTVNEDGPMDAQGASEVLAALGQALTAAAKVGVTHRDLAPKNILMTPDGQAKIINFGVATPGVNGVAGVPEFVAPEMIEGKSVDQRANIYSLGAVFYFLLTGQPPYQGDPDKVHEQHLEGDVVPPSAMRDDIPEMVDAVVIKAMERQSRHRFMTLRQLLTDVEQLAKGEFEMKGPGVSQRLARATGKGRERKKALSATRLGFSSSSSEAITLKKKGEGEDKDKDKDKDKDESSGEGEAKQAAAAATDAGDAPAEPAAAPDKGADAGQAVALAAKVANGDGAASGAPASTRPMDLGKVNGAAASPAPAPTTQAPPQAAASSEPAAEPPAGAVGAVAAGAVAAGAVAAGAFGASGAGAPPVSTPAAPPNQPAPAPKKPRAPTLPPTEKPDSRAEAKRRAEERIKRRKQGGDKSKFRETLWFKKGELDAEAAAKAEAAQKSGKQAIDKADMMPMEDRYEDDGSLTRGDREKFSLKTGSTQHSMAAFQDDGPVSAANSVTDAELINEMKGGRGKIIAFLIVGLIAVIGIVIFAATSGGHDSGSDDEKAKKPEIELPPEPPPVKAQTPDAGPPPDAAPVKEKPAAKKKKKKKKKKKRRKKK